MAHRIKSLHHVIYRRPSALCSTNLRLSSPTRQPTTFYQETSSFSYPYLKTGLVLVVAEPPSSCKDFGHTEMMASKLAFSWSSKLRKRRTMPTNYRPQHNESSNQSVYRFLLYSDDFDPHKSAYSQGSVGGVYIMPLGLPSEDKFSTTSVRCISLAPLGLSSNVVISAIMPDILRGATEGFPVKLHNGENVQLFLDLVSHVSDYPAATKLSDANGQKGLAPCTHCSFKLYGNSTGSDYKSGSRYANDTTVHSMNSSAIRTTARHESIYAQRMNERPVNATQKQRLGFSGADLRDKIRCPFHYFEKQLREARNRIPRTTDDRPVVPYSFCAYQSQSIGADHVLNGVMKNSLEACVWVLPASQRKEIDARLRHGLVTNGLPQQHRIFKLAKDDTFGLYSCSLSDCAAIFSIFAPVIETFYRPKLATSRIFSALYKMVCKLGELIGLTYFWPLKGVDSDADFEFVLGKGREKYHATLLGLAKEFVVLTNNASKLNLDVLKIIDKPNVHRVLELYIHTIPAFGHVRHIQELTFEHMHQSLKRIWEKHNSSEQHIAAVKESLFNDYIHRLFNARKRALSQDTTSDGTALNDILKLILGRNKYLPPSASAVPLSADMASIHLQIDALFTSDLDRALEFRSSKKLNAIPKALWRLHEDLTTPPSHFVDMRSTLRSILNLDGNLIVYKYASRSSSRGVNMNTSIPRYDRLYRCCACRVLVPSEEPVPRLVQGAAAPSMSAYFAIVYIFGIQDNAGVYAVAVRLSRSPANTYAVRTPIALGDYHVLQLNEGVRRVASIHKCPIQAEHAPDQCTAIESGRKHSRR